MPEDVFTRIRSYSMNASRACDKREVGWRPARARPIVVETRDRRSWSARQCSLQSSTEVSLRSALVRSWSGGSSPGSLARTTARPSDFRRGPLRSSDVSRAQ